MAKGLAVGLNKGHIVNRTEKPSKFKKERTCILLYINIYS